MARDRPRGPCTERSRSRSSGGTAITAPPSNPLPAPDTARSAAASTARAPSAVAVEPAAPPRPDAASSWLERIAAAALPLACALSWWTVAAFHREPPVAAEARYLGLLAAAVLYTALRAAPRPNPLLAAGGVLLGAIPWALPGTADRGAATGVLLAALLAAAAGSWPGAGRGRAAPGRTVVALALGAQMLARGGDLLAPSAFDVVAIVGLAGAAAGATLVLSQRLGALPAALAAATAFLFGPGFTAMTTLALAAPAAALWAGDRGRSAALRLAAAAALALPLLWDLERGALLALCAATLAGSAWARLVVSLVALTAFVAPGAERAGAWAGPCWLIAVLPGAAGEPGRERLARLALLLLALATAAQSTDPAALAAPAAAFASTFGGSRRVGSVLQITWSGLLAGLVAVLAGYPWLRATALDAGVALLGLGGPATTALAVLLLFGAAALALGLWPGAERRAELAPRALLLLLAPLALTQHSTAAALPLARNPVTLDGSQLAWRHRLDAPRGVSSLVLDSALSNAAGVPAGTVIAEVRLETRAGDRVVPVRAGVDTGEWAARREDVAAIPGFAAPPPFLHWVDAGGRFFGQRYRTSLAIVPPAREVTAIEVRRDGAISGDLALTLFHLELSP